VKRKVILVTDGDLVAKAAVETAARNIGARCISSLAGNPTQKTGREIINLIKQTPHDPVVIMVDDRGKIGEGKGETVLIEIATAPDIDVLELLL
jgi:stage V sporulation protein AE